MVKGEVELHQRGVEGVLHTELPAMDDAGSCGGEEAASVVDLERSDIAHVKDDEGGGNGIEKDDEGGGIGKAKGD
eukprot:1935400-Pyramimonas_sp.AAC.1